MVEVEESSEDPSVDIALLLQEGEQASFVSLIRKISKTSKFLLGINAAVALLACILLIISNRAHNIIVLLLVFIQPLIMLYFVYWRWYQSYSSLDYVIKMFAVGFWFSTFQSIVIETILQVVISIVFSPFISSSVPMDDYYTDDNTDTATAFSSLVRYIPFAEQEPSSDTKGPPPPMFYFMLYQVATAYVLAAGTEETMKHFAVRCCQFSTALKSPQVVLVYLFCAALGFATSENIEYVFGFASATKQSQVSAMEEEIFVLFVRVLMPVHLICSVLQAASLSTVTIPSTCIVSQKQILIYIFVHSIFLVNDKCLFFGYFNCCPMCASIIDFSFFKFRFCYPR